MIAPGTRLGAYEIVSLLGSGGMGEVYRARDSKLGRDVAIKVLPSEVAARPDALGRFEHEARAVAALSHPNILAIHDFGSADGVAFAVTELLNGQTLRDALVDGPLPGRRAVEFGASIARGLAAAHDRGIVHRDLKPENVFITSDNRVKILDFGLARNESVATASSGTVAITVKSPTEPGVILGTVGYMAPEQVRGTAVDWRADLFAFGAVFYEMVTGRRAFLKETAAETMTAILREDPPDDPSRPIPPALDRIIRHCLEKKPDARFRSAHDLAFALENVSGASTGSGRLAAPEPIETLDRRTPGRGAIGAAAAIALIAGLAIGWIVSASRHSTAAVAVSPTFRQVTFARHQIFGARFAPDGRTVVYSAGRLIKRLYLSRLESTGSTPLPIEDTRLLAVSANAELALLQSPKKFSPAGAGTLAQAPMIGGTPRSVMSDVTFADWNPRGDALAVVRISGSRHRLEFPVGTLLYETEGEIGYPRIAPSGDRVAFIDWPVRDDDRGTVAIVDLHGAKQTLSQTWESLSGLAWDPDGVHIWYSAAHIGMRYSLWTTAPGQPERRVYSAPGGLMLQDISRDGRVLLAQLNNAIQAHTWRPGEANERDISWIDYVFARDMSPDGSRVLLSTSGEGSSTNYDVFVCGIDGTGATRIGEGQAQQLSPDGRFALSIEHGPPVRLTILPLGAGERRTVPTGDVTPLNARWLRDGKHFLITGSQSGRPLRAFVIDRDGSSPPRPVSPEGISYNTEQLALSPDDAKVALRSPDGQVLLYPLSGATPEVVKGLQPDEMPTSWTADGRLLILPDGPPFSASHLLSLDPATGSRSALIEIKRRSDPDMDLVSHIIVSADGRSYVATYQRLQGTLLVADGLIPPK